MFWKPICKLLAGFFRFKYNDETDYVFKIIVSMVPIAVVGLLFKDKVEALFSDNLFTVAVCLIVTAILLYLSDVSGRTSKRGGQEPPVSEARNGISYWQALVVGLSQAVAVAPGLSRSGTTIATGLLCGVKREVMAQFSFLMVIPPILGELLLDGKKIVEGAAAGQSDVSLMTLAVGFVAAFISGALACKWMINVVRRGKLIYFAIYCAIVGITVLMFSFLGV